MYLLKPKFEQARHEALKHKKPIREADVASIQAKLVHLLDHTADFLVERAKRPNHHDPLLEITVAWMGPASSHREINAILRETFPGDAFGDLTVGYHLEDIEETVHLRFVGTSEDRYITGRILVRV